MSPAKRDLSVFVELKINRHAAVLLYRQLYLQLRDSIVSGRLNSGARLPSTRQLCLELGVSRTVVIAAYDQLCSEGYIEPRRGSGQFVSQLANPQIGTRATSRESQAVVIRRGPYLPFDPSVGVLDAFPNKEWARSLARGWRREFEIAAGKQDPGGVRALRVAIRHHLYALKGIVCSDDQILITDGLQDALTLIVGALHPIPKQHRCVWVEDPGHVGARQILGNLGLTVAPIMVDQEGLVVSEGIRQADHACIALVTPSRQFPLGVQMSLRRRTELLSWAKSQRAMIVEDDYDSEISFSGRRLGALFSSAPESVCLIGSFSKLMFPGLRLGYILASSSFAARLISVRMNSAVHLATSAQPALAEFIDGGGFARHLRIQRRLLRRRRETLLSALRKLPDDSLIVQPHGGGMHVTAVFTEGFAASMGDVGLAVRAKKLGLHIDPLSAQSVVRRDLAGLLLGYAAWDEVTLSTAVAKLLDLIIDVRQRLNSLRP